MIQSFFTFTPGFVGGVFVAAADFNNDNRAEVIVSADAGGGPHVKVFDVSGSTPTLLFSFFAYARGFTGGVRVAAGDVNGDGTPDIIAAAGPGGGPHVRVFSGANLPVLSELRSFFAFDRGFTGGIFVSAGDFNGDNSADIVVGAGAGGGPHVRVFSGADVKVQLQNFFAYNADFRGGVVVAATDLNGDNTPDLVTGPGPSGNPRILGLDVSIPGTALLLRDFFGFSEDFFGGVFVAGSLAPPTSSTLRIESDGFPVGEPEPLTLSQLNPLIAEAINQLEQAGLAAADSLSDVTVEIVDFEGDQLGGAVGRFIFLDRDAAGYGWFIDPTPGDDLEFQNATPAVQGRFDLLTVIVHELGHVLGLDHHANPTNFMAERLALSTRSAIEEDDFSALDLVFAEQTIPDLFETVP